MDEEKTTAEAQECETERLTEERLMRQVLGRFRENPYYSPTKPVTQRYRIQIYSILTAVAIAAGMFADHEWMFVGVVIIIKGIDLLVFRLRHGWYWRLTDKYLMLAGAVIAYASYKDGRLFGMKQADEWSLIGFFASLGIIYPLLTMLEIWIMKLRCRKQEEAAVVDGLDSLLLLLPGAGFDVTPHYGPIFKVWRSGQETYICDEWFTKTKVTALYGRDEAVTIRVHPRHDTEIYDKKRVRAFFRQKWKAWGIYDAILLSLWISPYALLLDLAVFVFLADRHYKKTGEE